MGSETECEQIADQALSGRSRTVDLGTTLDITMVAEMHKCLREHLETAGDVSLDAGEIERLDAAGLQLLVAFAEHARSAGLRVRWLGVSPSLEESAAISGLGNLLELPTA